MKSEIQTLLRAYADRMRRQADTIEKIAGALSEVADSDERFRRKLYEVVRPPTTSAYPSPPYPPQPQHPLSDLFRSLDELTESELDQMRRSVP
jgi:hypothetical protein